MNFRHIFMAAVLAALAVIQPAAAAEPLVSLSGFKAAVARGLESGGAASARSRCDAGAELTVEEGVARRSALLDRMTGFAKEAGTTGGLGKKVFVVTSRDDARERGGTGPAGSLREALFLAKQQGGGWITFADEIGERRIDLVFALFVPSNVTIDGGCRGMALSTPGTSVLVVNDVENVVITRVRLEQRAPFNKGRGDCVSAAKSDRLWVAYSSLRRCEDGLIDFGMKNFDPNVPARATFAFNHLSEHEKDMLFATYDCSGPNVGAPGCDAQLSVPWTWGGGVQVTLQGNLYEATSQRHPRLAGQTYAHMVDNVVAFAPIEREPGKFGANYGSYAGAGSRLYAQNNLYVALDVAPTRGRRKAIRVEPGQSATRLEGNVVVGEADADEGDPDKVPPPPYKLGAKADLKNPATAIECAASKVGPGGLAAEIAEACQ